MDDTRSDFLFAYYNFFFFCLCIWHTFPNRFHAPSKLIVILLQFWLFAMANMKDNMKRSNQMTQCHNEGQSNCCTTPSAFNWSWNDRQGWKEIEEKKTRDRGGEKQTERKRRRRRLVIWIANNVQCKPNKFCPHYVDFFFFSKLSWRKL